MVRVEVVRAKVHPAGRVRVVRIDPLVHHDDLRLLAPRLRGGDGVGNRVAGGVHGGPPVAGGDVVVGDVNEDVVVAIRPGLRKVPGGGAVPAGDGAGEIVAAPARCGLIGLPTVWGGLEIGESKGFVERRGGEGNGEVRNCAPTVGLDATTNADSANRAIPRK